MKFKATISSFVLLVVAISGILATTFLVNAIYADATIPHGQVNESFLGYLLAFVFALTGAALYIVYRRFGRN